MNRILATALLTAASLVAPAVAVAESRLQATIPFEFTAGNRLMPAGAYVIDHLGPSLLSFRCWKGRDVVTALILIRPGDDSRKKANRLMFDKYGEEYFLSEIFEGERDGAKSFYMSKHEQRLRFQRPIANQEQAEIALKH